MILTCPQCATRYLAKDEAIGVNGRTVRCSNCNESWFVAAEPDEILLRENKTAAEIIPVPASGPNDIISTTEGETHPDNVAPAALSTASSTKAMAHKVDTGAHVKMRDKADERRRRQRLKGVVMIWGTSLALLAIAALLAFIFRQDIINRVPKTATAYKALGVNVSKTGLALDQPVPKTVLVDGKPVLIVNGQVRNIASKSVAVPLIKLSLQASDGTHLAEWFVEIDKDALTPGDAANFITEYPTPPLDAVKLSYAFAEQKG